MALNAAHQFAFRHALSIYAAEAIYSFIPKNACSTMRYTLGLANGTVAGPADLDWIHTNNQTFQAGLAELARPKYTFVILRDPYTRIASLYVDKMVIQTDVSQIFYTLTGCPTPRAMLTFREFVMRRQPQLQGNEHWHPHVDFLVYENYDDYFCLEAFQQAVMTLRGRTDPDVQDARRLTKHGSDRCVELTTDEPFADVPARRIAALKRAGQISRTAQLYDSSLVSEVGKLHVADIDFYSQLIGRPCAFLAQAVVAPDTHEAGLAVDVGAVA